MFLFSFLFSLKKALPIEKVVLTDIFCFHQFFTVSKGFLRRTIGLQFYNMTVVFALATLADTVENESSTSPSSKRYTRLEQIGQFCKEQILGIKNTMSISPLKKIEKFNELLDNNAEFVVYKHSSICSVSEKAKQEVLQFLSGNCNVPFYQVLVIEDRPVSTEIAQKIDVIHHSPQILWIKNGAVVWHCSHNRITKQALDQQCSKSTNAKV